jgi:hypothetical protein
MTVGTILALADARADERILMNIPMPIATLGLGLPELVMILVLFAWLGFWIWMIIDCATREEPSGSKIAWLLVIVLVGLIGAPIYFFARKLRRKTNAAGPPPL